MAASGRQQITPPHLFAYGTLMCADIMLEVADILPPSQPCILKGFSRFKVQGEHYPAIRPDARGVVPGVVYRDLPASAWQRLDRFEGEMYSRERVQVGLDDGTTLTVATYVVRPEFYHCLEAVAWDFDLFVMHGKAQFQGAYKGYESL